MINPSSASYITLNSFFFFYPILGISVLHTNIYLRACFSFVCFCFGRRFQEAKSKMILGTWVTGWLAGNKDQHPPEPITPGEQQKYCYFLKGGCGTVVRAVTKVQNEIGHHYNGIKWKVYWYFQRQKEKHDHKDQEFE